jgi:hypothetical protein
MFEQEDELNADPNKYVVMDSNAMTWKNTSCKGFSYKLLEKVIDPRKGRSTSLIKLDPGTTLPTETLDERCDLLVLEGTLHDGHSLYGEHTFIRNQPGYLQTLSSQTGCVLYSKRRKPIRKTDTDRSVIDAKNIEWKPYPARGARVLHLYRDQHGVEAARLVDVYPDKQIPTHDHAMGDETFVVGGVIMDEHGSYGSGVWIRTPIGIPHTPFTKKDNVIMLIRDGDMVW